MTISTPGAGSNMGSNLCEHGWPIAGLCQDCAKAYKASKQELPGNRSRFRPRKRLPKAGARVQIPVSQLEYTEGGDTIWIHGTQGATVLRIKVLGRISSQNCDMQGAPSHADLVVASPLQFCLGKGAEY